MTDETTDPDDAASRSKEQAPGPQKVSGESRELDADSAEERLEELADTPALEEDEDSLVETENS